VGRVRVAWICLCDAFRAKSLYAFILGVTGALTILVIPGERLQQLFAGGWEDDPTE